MLIFYAAKYTICTIFSTLSPGRVHRTFGPLRMRGAHGRAALAFVCSFDVSTYSDSPAHHRNGRRSKFLILILPPLKLVNVRPVLATYTITPTSHPTLCCFCLRLVHILNTTMNADSTILSTRQTSDISVCYSHPRLSALFPASGFASYEVTQWAWGYF